MKKIILVIICLIVIGVCINVEAKSEVLIPDEAIRFRVLANSNSIFDQEIKMKVTNDIQHYLYKLLKNKKSISESRGEIKKNLLNIKIEVQKTLNKYNSNLHINVKYGYNYFPEKNYKGIKYDKGNYESLIIELGKGEGDNWWCVLFPPLCLMEGYDSSEVEYKFFVSELINKYFNK